jgi:hypothetical protein
MGHYAGLGKARQGAQIGQGNVGRLDRAPGQGTERQGRAKQRDLSGPGRRLCRQGKARHLAMGAKAGRLGSPRQGRAPRHGKALRQGREQQGVQAGQLGRARHCD